MTEPQDPDELIRAANPIDERRLPDPSQSAQARLIFEKITGTPYIRATQPRLARRWTRLRVYLAAVVGVAGISGGIAFAVTISQPTKHLNVACYTAPSLGASLSQVAADSRGALRDCASAWSSGNLPGQLPQPPPPLVACVLRSGIAGVFPNLEGSPDVCRRLGLHPVIPPPPPVVTTTSPGTGSSTTTPPATVPPMIAARNTVVAALSGSCLDATQATTVIRHALDQVGLNAWVIQVRGTFSPSRPCASPGFNESGRAVYIIPIPPPTAP